MVTLSFTPGFLMALSTWIVSVQCAPKGHLEPLGNHRPADIPMDEYDGPVDPDRFYNEYVLKYKPVVFRGAARHSPAFELWTDDYLAKEYGDLELRLEEKEEGESNDALPAGALGIGRDIMSNFISHYRSSNGYIVSELPSPMFKDIAVLPSMACSVLQHKIQEVNLWLSAKGAYSKIHRDAFNAINCLLNGTKDWFFIDKKYDKEVYVVHKSKWEAGGMSLVEPRRVDLKRYPKFADVHYSFVTINAGDCLYVPGGVYHQVHSYGAKNLAVSLLFSQMAREVHSRGCEDGELRYKLLNESNVIWPYRGSGVMSMGSIDVDFFHTLVENFTLLNGNRLTTDGIHQAILDLNMPAEGFPDKSMKDPEEEEQMKENARVVFDRLNVDKKAFLTTEDLDKVSVEEWKAITLIVEPVDTSNTYNFEYTVIDKRLVIPKVKKLLASSSKMTREEFLDIYTKKAHGSVYIGNKIFDKLDKKSKGYVTKKGMKRGMSVLEDLFSEQEHFDDLAEDEEEFIRNLARGKGDNEEEDEEEGEGDRDGMQEGEEDDDGRENEEEDDPEADKEDRNGGVTGDDGKPGGDGSRDTRRDEL